MSSDDLRSSFDAIAQQYDAVRPGYPPAILPLILHSLAAGVAPVLLEVGCGSGQATQLFAPHGMPITATDISPALLAAAQQRLAAFPNVQFVSGAFEELALPDAAFSIVLSAQAFHWVDQHVGMPKAFRLLQPGGVLALVWNFIDFEADPALLALRDALVQVVPAFAGWPDASDQRFRAFAASWRVYAALAPFATFEEDILPSTLTLDHARFGQLIATFSWFQTQSAAGQQQVLVAVEQFLAGQPAVVAIPIHTLLVRATKQA